MRLTQAEISVLKDSLKRTDPSARLYLFGSRLDDAKKGGDIDLLIKSKSLKKTDARRLRMDFYQHFGEQKMDILVDDDEKNNPFLAKIWQQAAEL